MDFQLTNEQKELQKFARDLAKAKFAEKAFTWDEKGEPPFEHAKILAHHGLLGITVPEEDGGAGGTLFDALLVMEAVAQICPHTADMIQVGNFGGIRQLAAYGSPALKKRILPTILGGEKMISAAMSEPDAGSASTDLRTTARIDGDKVVINGSKIFNTNGPFNSYYVVWVRFGNDVRSSGAILVERGAPGFTVGKLERHMSGEAHCALYFDNCEVPVENILVREDGFRKLFPVFNIERLGNAIRSLSLAQAAFDMAVEHAKVRRQFDRPLCEFQGLQWKFAEMKIKLEAARLMIYRAAANAEKQPPTAMDTAMAKAFANQSAFEVVNEALQIFGGYGYSTEYPIEYLFRRIRGWMIAGGTIEILKNKIAEGIFERSFSQRPPKAK
ncbi:acyl-CoA dehydrogenase [Fodinisporobacter ferrooxydans]|uniref:Acyl-CoA dehydrogenase n=1 Tax=Fodinisporobacter ferrooxydans TaxID=2901836 RepID=A0ABY4CNZ0_9BACL|nr:acyl-CoA dehydrogenase [Alicyclobacillaceae bacterium MYW30-H2]